MPVDDLFPDHLFPRRRRSLFVDPIGLMPLVRLDEAVRAFRVSQGLSEPEKLG